MGSNGRTFWRCMWSEQCSRSTWVWLFLATVISTVFAVNVLPYCGCMGGFGHGRLVWLNFADVLSISFLWNWGIGCNCGGRHDMEIHPPLINLESFSIHQKRSYQRPIFVWRPQYCKGSCKKMAILFHNVYVHYIWSVHVYLQIILFCSEATCSFSFGVVQDEAKSFSVILLELQPYLLSYWELMSFESCSVIFESSFCLALEEFNFIL